MAVVHGHPGDVGGKLYVNEEGTEGPYKKMFSTLNTYFVLLHNAILQYVRTSYCYSA